MAAIGLGACGPAHYERPLYAPVSAARASALPLRVAITYPEEGRSAPNRDVDLEPIVTSQCAETPTYISMRLEASRCLLDELRATRAFRAVHWAPERVDDYDLVVRMKLISSGEYFASDRCPAVLGPFAWDVVVTDRRGRALVQRRLTLGKVSIYAVRVWADFRVKEQAFLGELVPLVLAAAEQTARDTALGDAARQFAYVDRLDPELPRLRARLASGTLTPEERQTLERDYLLRLGMLESLRIIEERRTDADQQLKDRAWAEVQEQARRELQRLGERASAVLQESFAVLLGGIANAGRGAELGTSVRMAGLTQATAHARADLLQLVASPDGADTLLGAALRGAKSGSGGLARASADPAFRGQLSKRLQALGRAIDSSTHPTGEWMKEYRRLVAGGAPAGDPADPAAAAGAPAGGAATPVAAGCAKDTDCKGDRICVKRECVDPPARAAGAKPR